MIMPQSTLNSQARPGHSLAEWTVSRYAERTSAEDLQSSEGQPARRTASVANFLGTSRAAGRSGPRNVVNLLLNLTTNAGRALS